MTQEQKVWCWGSNAYGGVLGRASHYPVISGVPASVSLNSSNAPLVNAVELAAGDQHVCALIAVGNDTSSIRCWGSNTKGQLGNGNTANFSYPLRKVRVSSSPVQFLEGYFGITAGNQHTCALSSTGSVVCWGSNEFGQLGDGTTNSHNLYANNTVNSEPIIKLVAGGDHTCGLGINQKVYCWGKNDQGQLGNGTLVDANTPQTVLIRTGSNTQAPEILTGVVDIASGKNHVCATDRLSKIRCWGKNDFGQLGFINPVKLVTAEKETSPPNTVLDGAIYQIVSSAASDHACFTAGSREDRTTQLFCWGRNNGGQIGDLENHDVPFPKQIISRCTEFPLFLVTELKGGVEKKQVSINRRLLSVSLDSNRNIETCLSALPDKSVAGKGCFQINSFISGFTSKGEPICSSGGATP